MTERGTFIINGVERVIVNQIVRSPGVFFSAVDDPITGRRLYQAELRPYRGSWLEFSISHTDVLTVKIDRRRKFPATTFLRAIGYSSDEEILELFKDFGSEEISLIEKTLTKDPAKSTDESLLEIFRKMRPGDPVVLDTAKGLLDGMFFSSRRYNLTKVGRFKINKRLGLNIPNTPENWILTKNDVVEALKYLIKLANNEGRVDDIDHLANRRIRRVGELVQQNAFRNGILRLERVIKERMSLLTLDSEITPGGLINAKPVIAAINEFFRTSQLSSIWDQVNPLSAVDHLRRLSVMGTGGITRDRASFSIRDINHSQYGRIDPIRSPEGQNIGLVTYLALYSRINEYGFLETPYRKVILDKGKPKVTDEIIYLLADDEENYIVTEATVEIDDKGYIVPKRVPVRKSGNFFEEDAKEVSLIDISPQQVVGTSASLIPFLAHDDANRALMGTHMQCQAVPLLRPAAPIVGTGMERVVADNMGRVIRAPEAGTIAYVDGNKVTLKTRKEELEYEIKKFVNSPQGTCYSQRPVVSLGQKVNAGDLLIDGAATENGELALGQNLLIAYMSFDGLGYEDAIVISDRLVKDDVLTSIHIEEYEVDVVETKLGLEELTRDIPNVSEDALANLDLTGIISIGSEVGPNDILVGKVQPKGETELTAEERLLQAIFGEKAKEVRDTSLRMPHGERGTVIGVQILSRDGGDELDAGTLQRIKVKVAQLRKVTEGDKLAGRHGNKGVISKIIPEADMPYFTTGDKIDIIISPLSVLSRMNLGQLLETHWGIAAEKLGYKVAAPVFEKIPEEILIEELKKAGLPVDGKCQLIDGRTGQMFDSPVAVGKNYIMKLIHMVEEKIHARSTGPYSLVTQQPLGGKAQMGGQRLGEMEVWALEAYGAAHILQEMLTIKSDDVAGRAKAFEAIVKGTEIPQALVPESFRVLVKELQALGMGVQTLGAKIIQLPEVQVKDELKEEIEEMKRVLQAETSSDVSEIEGVESSPFEIIDAGPQTEEIKGGEEE
ncbi:DNA-directed RNA polymerase subunit beta [Candidatus Daviesbacteria bacterium RIFCSPHIGHO2_12_FULL_37_11]|uniref:DNA-directed RNA polymerase subunit beta n=1 Tax=Candidatus Daviesbacteria bacterium RIFCSPHIGHO2_12_FULL_37_11 TaxID=1797777 RepID=A0A1F5KCM7_9BACT|nr:MAG: DNA-directed RNA polymerase subunit beta [Candidatus Daviesbacteria bacterium GWA1_38_6]OGE16519.1 MAG: DNA-directed RNA polymerase subunit beta [Candidatus Daviesbacteria bacterium RIFCSPHIGHO2_01_FULL_37_27]OGE38604.1 MAG: DNA-directed RNA polymerase subunit beta [Candidatus Daviesbacteria bacterium RIFCSPHIGHO2_12_FULL_37_11]OGE46314.1 MAG: DNA-directed RNA polymerase subunit beta [Candidatus Daviesbacteria bacterium RIFCSPLOWO2_01_FULL_37_10]